MSSRVQTHFEHSYVMHYRTNHNVHEPSNSLQIITFIHLRIDETSETAFIISLLGKASCCICKRSATFRILRSDFYSHNMALMLWSRGREYLGHQHTERCAVIHHQNQQSALAPEVTHKHTHTHTHTHTHSSGIDYEFPGRLR